MQSYIDIRKNRAGQDRAFVRGTRLRVQDIVIDHQRFGHSSEQIALDYENLTLAQVHAALAFYFENRNEVQQAIRDDDAVVSDMVKQGSHTLFEWPLLARFDARRDAPVSS